MSAIVKFMKDEDGVVAIEYVIIAAALVGVLAAVFFWDGYHSDHQATGHCERYHHLETM